MTPPWSGHLHSACNACIQCNGELWPTWLYIIFMFQFSLTVQTNITDVPATDPPATDLPVTDLPATDLPSTDPLPTDLPATDLPSTDPPGLACNRLACHRLAINRPTCHGLACNRLACHWKSCHILTCIQTRQLWVFFIEKTQYFSCYRIIMLQTDHKNLQVPAAVRPVFVRSQF